MIARELTKMHEQVVTDSVSNLLTMLANGAIACKGEFVLLCQGMTAQHCNNQKLNGCAQCTKKWPPYLVIKMPWH